MRLTAAAPLAALLLAAAPAGAQQQDGQSPPTGPDPSMRQELSDADRYAACLDLAHRDPEAAVERARTWADTGGGDPARHCEAVALMAAGAYEQAAEKLETLAQRMDKEHGAALRADALAQAARAWILAGRPGRGAAALGQAIELTPQDVELWIDRAHARFQQGRYWEAIDDLNRASELAPERPDIYTYRGSAYRFVEAPQMARENIDRALELDPDNPGALFELGILHRLQGDKDAARQAWIKLLRVAPDAPIADAARENLEKMDVKVEEEAGS